MKAPDRLPTLLAASCVALTQPVAGQLRVSAPETGELTTHVLSSLPLPGQATPARFGRAGTGLGAGVTLAALATTAALASGEGNACRGSGDYLSVCRAFFVGGTLVGGGVGAVVGTLTRRATPSGRARAVLLGSSVAAVLPFALSLTTCEREDPTNPDLLCGAHGMSQPGITLAAAAVGGLLGYLLGARESNLQLNVGPERMRAGGTAWAIGATARTR